MAKMKQPEKVFNTGYKGSDKLFKYIDTHPHAIEGAVFSIAIIIAIGILLLFNSIFN